MTTRTTKQRAGREPGKFAGLKCAIYARKSNDDARHEEHISVARQAEQARRYVEARGGEVLWATTSTKTTLSAGRSSRIAPN